MSGGAVRRYARVTRSATYGFLAGLPLFLFYELVVVVGGGAGGSTVRLGAEIWTKEALGLLGLRSHLALGLVVAVLGAGIAWKERDRSLPVRGRYFLGLALESAVYAVVLAIAVSRLVGLILGAFPAFGDAALLTQIGLSVGAGLYEELVFRVLLVGGLYRLARSGSDTSRRTAYASAAVIGALIFSAVHYVGPLGDAFALNSFAFRLLYGLALNGLYIVRGFGVAAWTHALYDVMLVLSGVG